MLKFLFSLVLLGGLVGGLIAADAWNVLNDPLPATRTTTVVFERGQSLSGLVRELTRRNVFPGGRARHYVRLYARVTGIAPTLKAGEYEIEPDNTIVTVLEQLQRGDVKQYRFALIEGWNWRETLLTVQQHPSIRPTIDLTAADAGEQLMAALGRPDVHPEGRFLPDTYQMVRGTTDVEFLRRAMVAMDAALSNAWENRADGIPLTSPEQALILASIIEKETGLASERPAISGVFTRRLQRGMLLQTDPTVIYGIGPSFDGNIRRTDLRTDTPYNTYTRRGLTPTPICMPGRDALRAAVNPQDGDALYFVSRGDGSHKFSATLSEHNAAVREYQLRRRSR